MTIKAAARGNDRDILLYYLFVWSHKLSNYMSVDYYDMTSNSKTVRTDNQVGPTWKALICSLIGSFVLPPSLALTHLWTSYSEFQWKDTKCKFRLIFFPSLSHQRSGSVNSNFVFSLHSAPLIFFFVMCFVSLKPPEPCMWYWLVCANIRVW